MAFSTKKTDLLCLPSSAVSLRFGSKGRGSYCPQLVLVILENQELVFDLKARLSLKSSTGS
jgi:hypothetical protein